MQENTPSNINNTERDILVDEGVIKFNCGWIKAGALPAEALTEIKTWREKLYQDGLIGVTEDGIGYGNISIRIKKDSPLYESDEKNAFIISGTQTGKIEKLEDEHFTKVINFDLNKNSLACKGPIKASSESLTHAVIYGQNPKINAIIHTHNKAAWEKLMNQVPTTSPKVRYGTPELALEVIRLLENPNLEIPNLFIMSGHEGGILAFGETLETTANILYQSIHS